MSFSQISGLTHPAGSTPITVSQMSSSGGSVSAPRACCENGRPIMTDPHTGQTICSCQYGTALLNYTRVQGLPEGVYGASAAAAYAAGAAQGYVPLGTEGSAFYSPLTGSAFDMKEGTEAWRTLAAQSGGCFPYDPSMAIYPYGTGYGGLDLNARRKNATRETTNTLKAWLYEHRKNPYPTKGEKIMLAIITKMTLTQVSTWFANARRRLKKENKMTWSPRNRSEDGIDNDDDDEDNVENKENTGVNNDSISSNDSDLNISIDTENHDDKRGVENGDKLERIISVDDDDSNQSFGDLDDLDPCTDDNEVQNYSKHKDTDVSSPGSSVSECRTSLPVVSKSTERGTSVSGSTTSESESQMRPKIWSVSDFLGNSNKDSSSNSSTKSTNSPAVVCSRQKQDCPTGSPFLQFQTSQSLRNGQFPAGLSAYPLSLSHTTLSYPYTLTSATPSKSELSLHHAAALRASEHALKEGLVEKASRIQSGLFSPARDIDGFRVGGKMIL